MQMQLKKRREDGKIKVRKEKGRTKDEKSALITQRVVLSPRAIVRATRCCPGFIWKLDNYFVYFYAGSVLLTLLITLAIINSKSNSWPQDRAWLSSSCCLLWSLYGTGLPAVWLGQDRPLPAQKAAGHRHWRWDAIVLAHWRSGAERAPPDAANQPRYISHCAYCPPLLSEHHHRASSAKEVV